MVVYFKTVEELLPATSSPINDLSDSSEIYDENTPVRQCEWANCSKILPSLNSLVTHIEECHTYPINKVYYCSWRNCDRSQKGFNAKYKMLHHVRTHTKEKPHICYTCNKRFARAELLKTHSRSHTGEKPYRCDYEGCDKRYSNSSDKHKHWKTHFEDKPYACKIENCDKRYTDPSSLRKHVKNKHPKNDNLGTSCKNMKQNSVIGVIPASKYDINENRISVDVPEQMFISDRQFCQSSYYYDESTTYSFHNDTGYSYSSYSHQLDQLHHHHTYNPTNLFSWQNNYSLKTDEGLVDMSLRIDDLPLDLSMKKTI